MNSPQRALVLCLSGHDPGGGAGIQADIETVTALGGHALALITAHTAQDTTNVNRVTTANASLLREQLALVLADSKVQAVKVGLLGHPSQAALIAEAVRQAGAPLVLDPVLRAGGGANLVSGKLVEQMRKELMPLAEVITPNAAEARRLARGARTLEDCGRILLETGARNVLITGGDEPGDPVVNHWFAAGAAPRRFAWPRVAGSFHGAGCTLASALAVLLARGLPVAQALADAQAYTHRSLTRAFASGRGRWIPGRGGA